MPKMGRFVRGGEHYGEPVQADGGRRLVPVSRSWRLALPGPGWVLWSRAVGVIVEEEGGGARRPPVRDRTRGLQMGLLAAGLVTALLLRVVHRRREDRGGSSKPTPRRPRGAEP